MDWSHSESTQELQYQSMHIPKFPKCHITTTGPGLRKSHHLARTDHVPAEGYQSKRKIISHHPRNFAAWPKTFYQCCSKKKEKDRRPGLATKPGPLPETQRMKSKAPAPGQMQGFVSRRFEGWSTIHTKRRVWVQRCLPCMCFLPSDNSLEPQHGLVLPIPSSVLARRLGRVVLALPDGLDDAHPASLGARDSLCANNTNIVSI